MNYDLIFVPQGPEYRAVSNGLARSINPKTVAVIPLPMGIKPVTAYLQNHKFTGKRVVLIGLGGSLSPQYQIGDVVIVESCIYLQQNSELITKYCDLELVNYLSQQLGAKKAQGLTSDRLIYSAQEKQQLGQKYDVSVVDMEGIAILNQFALVTIIRVISDDCYHDLPNLSHAIDREGKLDNLKMAIAFIRQPLAALRLIKGSLKALKILKKTAMNMAKIKSLYNA
jgi:nucleoside phosphorylase